MRKCLISDECVGITRDVIGFMIFFVTFIEQRVNLSKFFRFPVALIS